MRRHLAAATLVSALVSTAACGSGSRGSSDEAPRDTVRAVDTVLLAADKAEAQKSAKVAMTVDLGEGGSVSSEGAIDFAAGRGSMSVDLAGLGLPGGGKAEMVYAGSTIYMKLPPGFPLPSGGKPWFLLDLEEIGKQTGVDLKELQQLGGNDPSNQLQLLAGASEDGVKEVGTETVRGVATTRYDAVVDLNKAAAQAPESARRAITQLVERLGGSSMPVSVWIDADGLPRRFEQTLTVGPAAGADAQTVRTRIEFYDYGTPVTVTIPPASQTQSFADLLESASGG
jgi:hypothetical protein